MKWDLVWVLWKSTRCIFFFLKTSKRLHRIHVSDKTLGCQFPNWLSVILERQWNSMVIGKTTYWSKFCHSEDLTICSTYRGRKGVSENGHSQPKVTQWVNGKVMRHHGEMQSTAKAKGGHPEFLWEEACRSSSQVQWSRSVDVLDVRKKRFRDTRVEVIDFNMFSLKVFEPFCNWSWPSFRF